LYFSQDTLKIIHMTKRSKISIVIIALFSVTLSGVVYGINMSSKNGFSVSLKSSIMGEDRNIWIHLPDNYENSEESYPVLFRLDGSQKLVRETVSTLQHLLQKKENTYEMIVVAIENSDRNKDMWPTHTMYYPESLPLGSKDFLAFIERELIPYISSHYRTNNKRIICGQSLSAVFTLYTFLSKPYLFDSFIACSGAFPDCEPFFKDLSEKAFKQPEQFEGKKLFITHGLKDPLDPDGTIHRQMTDFSNTIKNSLGDNVSCKYQFYKDEGHVPKNSLKDGLAWLQVVGQ